MIFIIGGTSRAGKTLAAKNVSKELRIHYLSIDWLVMGFGNGIPDFGIHHMLMPDDIANRIWPFLKAMIEGVILNNEECVIDGEALLPELVKELIDKYPNDIKVCFLGYTNTSLTEKVKQVKQYAASNHDWISDKSDEYITDHIKNMLPHSLYIKKSCKEKKIKFFDTSNDFEKKLDEVKKFMMD